MSWAAVAKTEPVKAAPVKVIEKEKQSVAVIDANAIINGNGLLNLMRSAEKIVTIPELLYFPILAVVDFARATGDLHALSVVDTRLLALAHSIEVSYYGSSHLRDKPPAPRLQKKGVADTKVLPGWGAEGGDWAEIDRLNEEEEAAAQAALSTAPGGVNNYIEEMGGEASRIAADVQQLSLDDDIEEAEEGNGVENGERAGGGGGGRDTTTEKEDEEDDDDWEVAAKTKNKQRRARRSAYRRAEYAAAALDSLEMHGNEEEDEEEESTSEEENEDGCSSDGSDTEMNADNFEAGDVLAHPSGEESAVCCITADFPMQNVLLQMGLRLAAPDGLRISCVSRWVLRCSACYQVTKEVGRLFCPRCGNAALDKVRVVVGPDGAEQYGVKKKHILRGTKFSIPKPRGGRNRDVILREDQLLTKKHLMRAQKAADRAAQDQLDPFAPEYTADTWHQAAALPGGQQGAAALLAGWKKNPNERKHRATNRRRK
ncbi:putative RNA-binding NOB1-like protein [Nannochloris sp. 'desiccata']|nr:putative RNA-binding NOB1-like protein [Chlorella desiccata (nom. nud.)]